MTPPTGAVLLASGGMDSTTLAYWLVRNGVEFVPLFIDYGQHCVDREYECFKALLPPSALPAAARISVPDVYRGSRSRLIEEADLWTEQVKADDMYLPYRNLLLLTIGAAFAQGRGLRHLYTAFINSNHAKEIDCSAAFFQELGRVLSSYGGVEVVMPFRQMTKGEVAQIGIELGVPIASTYSCQVASKVPCGACPNCVDRLEAIRSLG
jgi:7-cyano-7-deazaguanine synthase